MLLTLCLPAAIPAPASGESEHRRHAHLTPAGALITPPCRQPYPTLPWFGGGVPGYLPPSFVTVGPDGPLVLTPGNFVDDRPNRPAVLFDNGPLGGPMPVELARDPEPAPRARRLDPRKAQQFVTIGDRLFRAGNLPRASERYLQAMRTDPSAAAPRIRLAQVALVRGKFDEAAAQIRDAIAGQPQWLVNAPDIQSLYREPGDFTRQIAKLESHILLEPNDRDAWLVLGAELYLSGQTRRAADVFLRLTDRQPDPALSAFLDASRPVETIEK
ncbi:MAG: hypothetical protein NVSMB9_36960 [Isosphaeraceae bacterium]